MKISWYAPIRTISESNTHEHWTVSSKRHRFQQFIIKALFINENKLVKTPCTVKLTRLSCRFLDAHDNLRISMKWISDQISECIFPDDVKTYKDKHGKLRVLKGRQDDNGLITWEYDQEKAKTPGVKIEISYDE